MDIAIFTPRRYLVGFDPKEDPTTSPMCS